MRNMSRCGGPRFLLLAASLLLVLSGSALAEGSDDAAAEHPPCPLHMFEGAGGAFTTLSAWLVNPPAEGETFGLPAAGYINVHLGHAKNLQCFTLTECILGKVELGYGFSYLDMGDVPEDIERAFEDAVTVTDHAVGLHILNARYQAVPEGGFGVPWLPAVTIGAHYKRNETIENVDDDLGGALREYGIKDDDSIEGSLVVTKMITALPAPAAFSLGVRYTEAAHCGLLGFTGDRSLELEGNVCVLAAPWLILAAEYRSKPHAYTEIPGLLERESDWWTLDACFIVDSHLTIALGYGHFGWLLNHKANESFGIAIKYEF